MIYRLKPDYGSGQSVFTTGNPATERGQLINRKWSEITSAGFGYVSRGQGEAMDQERLSEMMADLISAHPNEMQMLAPPRAAADCVPFTNSDAMWAISNELWKKAPKIAAHIEREGAIVEYPFDFDLEKLFSWLMDERNIRKWPQLKKLGDGCAKIKWSGTDYIVCHPNGLIGFGMRVFVCSNWVDGILNRNLSVGSVDRYWTEMCGKEVFSLSIGRTVFRSMPPRDVWLFRVPEISTQLFCTQDFKSVYDEYDLSGLSFKPVEIIE